MKNGLIVLTAFLTILMFFGCSKDNNEEPNINISETDIDGIWTVKQMMQNGKTLDMPDDAVVFNIKSDHSYSVRFLDNNYIGTWKLDGNRVVGTTIDPIIENLTFTSLQGDNAIISYSNSRGLEYILKAIKTAKVLYRNNYTVVELESAPSYMYKDPNGSIIYITFWNGHLYTKEVTSGGLVCNQNDIHYTLSEQYITMTIGKQKTKGTITKLLFNDGNIGFELKLEGSYGIATWLSKVFKLSEYSFNKESFH